MNTHKVHLDFESYSELNIRLVGAHKYSRHPSTEVLIACYALDNGKIQTWVPAWDGPDLPYNLREYASDEDILFVAHNAEFEAQVWEHVMRRLHDAPPITLRRWRCTAVQAAACALPRSLDGALRAMAMDVQKNPEGVRLIQKFCKPRKPSKKNSSTRWMPDDAPEEFKRFVQYCRDDVQGERALDENLLPYPEPWRVYHHTMRMNMRGLPIDMQNIEKGAAILADLEKENRRLVRVLTGGIRPTQRDKMLHFLQDMGVPLENLQAKTINDLIVLNGHDMDEEAKLLLQLRIEGGKASTKKIASMGDVACDDGFVRGCFMPYGAHTGRDSGKLVQPQNYIRGDYEPWEVHFVHELIGWGDAEQIQLIYRWPIDAIAQAMRGFIKAPEGMKFVVCDFSAIEARALAWLAGANATLARFEANEDLYKLLAVKLYNLQGIEQVTFMQRKFSKDVFLGCGYQLGGPGFVINCLKRGIPISIEDAEHAVGVYREDNPEIVQLWKALGIAACNAVKACAEYTNPVKCRKLALYMREEWLCIKLPSGRELRYFRPQVKLVDRWQNGKPIDQLSYWTEFKGKLRRETTYGGKLTENVVQAIARDIMIAACFRAEREHYPVIGRVHDELITLVEQDYGSPGELESILRVREDWYRTAPINAEGWEDTRYRK